MVKQVFAGHSTLDESPSSNYCPGSDASALGYKIYLIVWPDVASALASVVSTANQKAY